ncbi:YitT family protein [Enterococcus bulliens]
MAQKKGTFDLEQIKKIVVLVFTGIAGALSINFFLNPAHVFSAGMNGLAQIIVGLAQQYLGISLSIGLFILILNIPIFILGFIKLGGSSTFLSFINVVLISVFTIVLPEGQVTDNILLNALVGGVLIGIGAGFSLKMGFTTGGMDILSLVFSKITGKTVGSYMLLLNGIIVLIAGFLFSWESALYTIISIYSMSRVVDAIHTSHQKVTAMITTRHADQVGKNISKHVFRGMTLLPSIGGYSGINSQTIMMVITRYELYDLEQAVLEIDENAFINILPTQSIMGRFATDDEQRIFKATGAFPELKRNRR